MRGLSFLLAMVVAGGVSLAQSTQGPAAPADLVVVNARVCTVDAAHPEAQAVAVRGDRLAVVGTNGEALALDDIMQVSPARVLDTRPVLTLRGGRATFRDGL